MRAASCDSTEAQLTMARLTGRGRTLALSSGPFDFDGRRLAWAAADGIHVARVP
jgi:hypothetical protein